MKINYLFVAAVLIICSSAMASGGKMIPGYLYLLKDGTQLSCAIEYSTGQGKKEASNPKTGEIFTGLYTGVFITDNYAECKGVMTGDKGTVIFLTMKINVGSSPFGFGDGIDNNDNKYQYHTLR